MDEKRKCTRCTKTRADGLIYQYPIAYGEYILLCGKCWDKRHNINFGKTHYLDKHPQTPLRGHEEECDG